MRILGFFCFVFIYGACMEPSKQHLPSSSSSDADSTRQSGLNGGMDRSVIAQAVSVVVFPNDSGSSRKSKGWGFDLFVDGQRLIHQPEVPVIGGATGFETADLAKRAGQRMAEKLQQGIMPPALDSSDLILIGMPLN